MISNLRGNPYRRFWKWFEENESSIAAVRSGSDPILLRLNRELRRVHPGLEFELGIGDNVPLEFIVSANGIRAVFPAVEKLVASAPPLPNWKVIAFRQPKDEVAEVQYGNFHLSVEDVWFSHRQRKDKFNLTIYIRDLAPGNTEQAIGASFVLLDNALGEFFVTTRIGEIEHKPLPDEPAVNGLHPLREIRAALA